MEDGAGSGAYSKKFSISPGSALRPHRFESLHRALYGIKVAERKGFEPPLPFPVNLISNQAPSATRPPLRGLLDAGEGSASDR